MAPEDKEWLKLYLIQMSDKIDDYASDVKSHMAKDDFEHRTLHSKIDNLQIRLLKWMIPLIVGTGVGTAGLGKAIAAILGGQQ